jgi:hypothetical protein
VPVTGAFPARAATPFVTLLTAPWYEAQASRSRRTQLLLECDSQIKRKQETARDQLFNPLKTERLQLTCLSNICYYFVFNAWNLGKCRTRNCQPN